MIYGGYGPTTVAGRLLQLNQTEMNNANQSDYKLSFQTVHTKSRFDRP